MISTLNIENLDREQIVFTDDVAWDWSNVYVGITKSWSKWASLEKWVARRYIMRIVKTWNITEILKPQSLDPTRVWEYETAPLVWDDRTTYTFI